MTCNVLLIRGGEDRSTCQLVRTLQHFHVSHCFMLERSTDPVNNISTAEGTG